MNKSIFKDCSTSLFKIYPSFRRSIYWAFDSHSVKMTRTQQTILITMMNFDTLSMSELARSINTSNEQATRAVAQLVERGYINRVQNEKNRRIVNISLTESARELLNELIDLAAGRMSDKLAHTSTAEIRKLEESMSAVDKIINAR